MTNEIWKEIPRYKCLYEVSTLGRVRSIKRKKPHLMHLYHNKKGYIQCDLLKEKNGKRRHERVHILVAETFIPNPKNKPTVNHINEIKDDNRIENLEWATYSEQQQKGTVRQRISESLKRHFTELNKYQN